MNHGGEVNAASLITNGTGYGVDDSKSRDKFTFRIDVTRDVVSITDFILGNSVCRAVDEKYASYVFPSWNILRNGTPSPFFEQPDIKERTKNIINQATVICKNMGFVILCFEKNTDKWLHNTWHRYIFPELDGGASVREVKRRRIEAAGIPSGLLKKTQKAPILPIGIAMATHGRFILSSGVNSSDIRVKFVPMNKEINTMYDFVTFYGNLSISMERVYSHLQYTESQGNSMFGPNGTATSLEPDRIINSSVYALIDMHRSIKQYRHDRDLTSNQQARPSIYATKLPEKQVDPSMQLPSNAMRNIDLGAEDNAVESGWARHISSTPLTNAFDGNFGDDSYLNKNTVARFHEARDRYSSSIRYSSQVTLDHAMGGNLNMLESLPTSRIVESSSKWEHRQPHIATFTTNLDDIERKFTDGVCGVFGMPPAAFTTENIRAGRSTGNITSMISSQLETAIESTRSMANQIFTWIYDIVFMPIERVAKVQEKRRRNAKMMIKLLESTRNLPMTSEGTTKRIQVAQKMWHIMNNEDGDEDTNDNADVMVSIQFISISDTEHQDIQSVPSLVSAGLMLPEHAREVVYRYYAHAITDTKLEVEKKDVFSDTNYERDEGREGENGDKDDVEDGDDGDEPPPSTNTRTRRKK